MTCKHEQGWILKEEICINEKNNFPNQEVFQAEFECNSLDCFERKLFTFEAGNLEEVKG